MHSKRGVFHLNRTPTEQPSIYKGLILASFSGFSFSIVAVIVKQMKNIHPGQLALYRIGALFVLCIPETVKRGQHPLGPRKFRFLMVIMGLVTGLCTFLTFISFQYLSLGEASVIIFSSPVFTTIFARIFFKEPCSILNSISVILTVIGIIFTSKLPSRLTDIKIVYSSDKVYGLLVAISAMFSVTGSHLITRKMRSVHQSIINFNYGWMAFLQVTFMTAVFGNFQWHQCGIQTLYILLLALFSYCGITMLLIALQCEYAGPATTMRSASEIIMAFLWQIFLFHDVPDYYGIIGAVLVSTSIICIGFGKWFSCPEKGTALV